MSNEGNGAIDPNRTEVKSRGGLNSSRANSRRAMIKAAAASAKAQLVAEQKGEELIEIQKLREKFAKYDHVLFCFFFCCYIYAR
jgi:hypothetical protein